MPKRKKAEVEHPEIVKGYVCPDCMTKFKTDGRLDTHKRTECELRMERLVREGKLRRG